jgi:hypothetical protein
MKFLITLLIVCQLFKAEFVSTQRQRRSRREQERDITADEIVEITEDKTIVDDEDELANKAMM